MDPLAHASVGLMAKSAAPEAPLWMLLAATQVPDLLFFGFEAAGLEYQADTQVSFSEGLTYLRQGYIAWSHGLMMCIVWAVVVAAIAFLFYRNHRASIVIGLMVLSHWLLDFIVYPNMPVFFDGPLIGIGLITSSPGFIAGIVLEIALIAGGIMMYWRTRKRATARA